MHSLQMVDLASRNTHMICFATPSENVKLLVLRTGGPAGSFWHLLTKKKFVTAMKGAFVIREGNKTAAEAASPTRLWSLKKVDPRTS